MTRDPFSPNPGASIWNFVSHPLRKSGKWLYWNKPFNNVISWEKLLCTDDRMLIKVELAAEEFTKWFASQIIPSPYELARKTFTGGYRCGFYFDTKVKSPVEIIWGEGTAKMIGEIFRPVGVTFMYMWLTQIEIDALSAWTSWLYRESFCTKPLGNFLVENKAAPVPAGHAAGSVPGGTVEFDPFHCVTGGDTAYLYEAGPVKFTSAFIFETGSRPLHNIRVGHLVDGVPVNMTGGAECPPFSSIQLLAEYEGTVNLDGAANSYFECDSDGTIPGFPTVGVAVFTGEDHRTIFG